MSSAEQVDISLVGVGIGGFSRTCRVTLLAMIANPNFKVAGIVEEFMDLDYMAFQLRLDVTSFGMDLNIGVLRVDGLEYLLVGEFRINVFHAKNSFDAAFSGSDAMYVFYDSTLNMSKQQKQVAQLVTLGSGVDIYMLKVALSQSVSQEFGADSIAKLQESYKDLLAQQASKRHMSEQSTFCGDCSDVDDLIFRSRQRGRKVLTVGFRPRCVCCRLQTLSDEAREDT